MPEVISVTIRRMLEVDNHKGKGRLVAKVVVGFDGAGYANQKSTKIKYSSSNLLRIFRICLIFKGEIFLKVKFFELISTTFEFSRQNDMHFSLKLTFQFVKFG